MDDGEERVLALMKASWVCFVLCGMTIYSRSLEKMELHGLSSL
jgi:hypothetical protein